MEERSQIFGERLASLRKRLHLTQKELGEKSKVSYSSISEYESGKATPRRETLEKLAKALGVSIYELSEETEKEERKFREWRDKLRAQSLAADFSLQLMDYILVPVTVVRQVLVGKPTSSELRHHRIDLIRLPREMATNIDYALRTRELSMISKGILEGDILLVRTQSSAENGDIVIVKRENGEYAIKEYKEAQEKIWFDPPDTQTNLLEENLEIIGIITYVIRRLKLF